MYKGFTAKFILVLIAIFFISTLKAGVRIVVLGSSTAAGSGPVDINNSWVLRYSSFLRSIDARNSLFNLAKGGYVTFQAMPTDYVPPLEVTFLPDSLHNITKAITLSPHAIIINFPSNDISYGISIDQQIENYNVMIAKAKEKNVPVWICTSQPVNYGTNQASRDKNKALKLRIQAEYNVMSIDFYTGLCDSIGKILPQYDSGDGLHLNDAGHEILYERVVYANILTRIAYNPDSVSQLLKNSVLVDFGAVISPAPWNNISSINVNSVGSKVDNLLDNTGQKTGLSMEVSKSFYGLNAYGASITATSLSMPNTVSSDNFYTGGGFGQLLMTGMNTNQLYTFTFFGSRTETGGPSRETKYTVSGNNSLSGVLETRNNISNVLILSGIKAALNKSVTIEVSAGPGNLNTSKYSHLSAMKISAETLNSFELPEKDNFNLRTEKGKLFASFSGSGDINIYNLTGELIYSQAVSNRTYATVELYPPAQGISIVLFRSDLGIVARKVFL
jgi:lysophospholipase L1-like esterase